ncbi:MAG: hypothetical protein ACRC1H_04785 [Caldilineaceae bacterium]
MLLPTWALPAFALPARSLPAMNAMLYLPNRDEPVAVLDDVKLIEFNDNHTASPTRAYYKTRKLNAGRLMLELHRDERLQMHLQDGRVATVLLQHNSLDMEGNYVGVLRVAAWQAGSAQGAGSTAGVVKAGA